MIRMVGNFKTFAYVRVSTKNQNEGRQLEAIREYCAEKGIDLDERDIFIDKVSGKDFNRPDYQALKRVLRSGDTFIIKELDRLGRNMEMIREEWNELIRIGVNIVIIDTPILNTANKTDLEKSLISNIVFELLSYMAEKERVKIKQRQEEGIKNALNNGVRFGRPKVEIGEGFVSVYGRVKSGEITAVEAMKALGMTKATYYRRVKEYEEKFTYQAGDLIFHRPSNGEG